MFMRGSDHVKDVGKKRANKPLWNHILEKHKGIMEVPIFSHFSRKLHRFLRKPQRRKADEGVWITKLNPTTRMNSKNEFLRGTNISMQQVRGVGIIQLLTTWVEREYFSGGASEDGAEILGPFTLNNLNSLMAEGLVAVMLNSYL